MIFDVRQIVRYGSRVLAEEAARPLPPNAVDFDGYWITTEQGRRIFIGAKALLMKPTKPKGFKMKKIKHTRKDGTVYYEEVEPAAWVERKSRYKFAKVASIARNWDTLKTTLERECGGKKLNQKKAVAACLLVIHHTGERIGGGSQRGPGQSMRRGIGQRPSPEDVVETFGISTLQRRHAKVSGSRVTLDFIGKAGIAHHREIEDPILAQAIGEFLGGRAEAPDDATPLFTYQNDDGFPEALLREHVDRRLKKINDHYTPKDLRTTVANFAASEVLLGVRKKTYANEKERKAAMKALLAQIGEVVAAQLINTPAVALASYVNPFLVEAALEKAGLA